MTARPDAPGRSGTESPTRGSPVAVAVMFAGNGLLMASTFSRVPQIKDQVGATATELAFALVCIGIGSIVAMPFTGRLVNRFSSRTVSQVATAITLVGYAVVPLASSVPVLAAVFLIGGLGVGVGDVAMNVQGHLVEQRHERVLMTYWHGLFSLGAVVGALAGSWAAFAGVPLGLQFGMVSAVLAVTMGWATLRYLPDAGLYPARVVAGSDDAGPPTEPAEPAAAGALEPSPTARRTSITGTELLLGVMVFATAVGEGAANDWMALVLVDARGAPEAVGALTYAGFNLTMAIGRFVGGGVIQRFGRVPVLRVAGLIAAAGIAVVCLVPSAVAALVGAAAWGLGLSVVFPSAMSAAGEVPERGGRAIAVVSTIGYGGFLLGAPLIGTLAHVIPLDLALLVVAVLALLVVFVAPAARERRSDRAGTDRSAP